MSKPEDNGRTAEAAAFDRLEAAVGRMVEALQDAQRRIDEAEGRVEEVEARNSEMASGSDESDESSSDNDSPINDEADGCGCAATQGGSAPASLAFLVGLLGLGRLRRRSAA